MRELGLNLSTTADASVALTQEEKISLQPVGVHTKRDVVDPTLGRLSQRRATKVTRYFPGQVPKWVKPEEEERVKAAPVILSRTEEETEEFVAGDVVKEDEPEPEAEDEDDVAARRARVRAKLKLRQEADAIDLTTDVPEVIVEPQPEEAKDEASEEEEEEEEESSSESESESSEEEEEEVMQRPSFVPRAQRETIFEAMELERKAKEAKEKEKQRKLERANESRVMVAEAVAREETVVDDKGIASDADAPDDTDDPDDEVELTEWRIRELKRWSRDAEQRRASEVEAAETERRRNLTQEERQKEDALIGKGVKKPKAKWKFLQKYHHKGAFFMDDAEQNKNDVRNRETDGATGVDKFDRSKLPAVLQVRDFGFAGRTKYTHLVDQDTTFIDKDYEFNGWLHKKKGSNPVRQRYDSKRAGIGDIDKPFSSSSSKDKRRKRPQSSSSQEYH